MSSCLPYLSSSSVRPILNLLTPKGIKGFPALPNPEPILGDLLVVVRGVRKTGGMSIYVGESAQQLGPNFQLRMLNQRLNAPSALTSIG